MGNAGLKNLKDPRMLGGSGFGGREAKEVRRGMARNASMPKAPKHWLTKKECKDLGP